MNSLYSERDKCVPFWIDTLYVPVDEPGRSMVIKSIPRVHAGADKVLVLDSSLATSA